MYDIFVPDYLSRSCVSAIVKLLVLDGVVRSAMSCRRLTETYNKVLYSICNNKN